MKKEWEEPVSKEFIMRIAEKLEEIRKKDPKKYKELMEFVF
jgi:hypothetical protein